MKKRKRKNNISLMELLTFGITTLILWSVFGWHCYLDFIGQPLVGGCSLDYVYNIA